MSGVRTVLLKDICNFEKGSTGLMKAEPGEYPLVTTGKDRRSCESYQFDTKAVCIPLVSSTGHGHASLNNVHYQEGKFALGTILVAITAKNEEELDVHFLHLYLSQLKDIVLVPLMKGAANVSLSITAIKNIEVPLPSIARQKEIVEKFKSTIKEENELINQLYLQRNLLKDFRQQVLKEAIRGELTSEWRKSHRNIESATYMLDAIKLKKQSLIDAGHLKKSKNISSLDLDNTPFSIPSNWEWSLLEDVGLFERGKSKHRPRNDEYLFQDGKYPFIQTGDVAQSKKNSYIISSYKKCYNEKGLSQSRLWCKGTLCITIAANIAETGFLGIDACFPDSVVGFTSLTNKYTAQYIKLFIDASKIEIEKFAPATAQKNINLGIINNLYCPIPPLSELEEIVRKVNEIFKLCDDLDSKVNENLSNAEELIHAVLKEEFIRN